MTPQNQKMNIFWPVVGIRIRMFLGLQDPDPEPLVRGTNPELDPSLFSYRCWADWNTAFKIQTLAKNLILKTEDNVPAGQLLGKKYEMSPIPNTNFDSETCRPALQIFLVTHLK